MGKSKRSAAVEGANRPHAGKTGVGTVLVFLAIVEVTSGFVQGFYTPLLPDLARHVGVPGEAMNWFQTAQAMAAAVMVPLMSRMGDVFGARKILRLAIVSVLIGTLMIALVPSYPLVLLGRIFIGPLGVWLPLAIAIIFVRTVGGSATRSISILSASLMAGIVIGTVAAGLAEAVLTSLPVMLLIPSVMVLISAYAVFFQLPKDIDLSAGRIDWLGFGGLGAFMLTLILALAFVGPSHATLSLTLFAVAGAIFVLWVFWEKKAADPAVDFDIVLTKSMGPLYVTAFAIGVVMIDAPPNLADFVSKDPQVYSYGFGASSALLAALIAVLLLFATTGGFLSSFIAAKFGMRRTLVGACAAGVLGQLMLVPLAHSMLAFWVSGSLTGLGMGILVGTLPALVSHAAPEGRTGIANGIYSALLAMGGAVGGAVFRQVLVAFRDEHKITALGGYMTIWGISAVLFVVAGIMMAIVALPSSDSEPAAG